MQELELATETTTTDAPLPKPRKKREAKAKAAQPQTPRKPRKLRVVKDGDGHDVPQKYIDPIVLLRNKIVNKHFAKAIRYSSEIEAWKAEIYADIDTYYAAERARYGKDSSNPGQTKTLPDFTDLQRITIDAYQSFDFDDRIWIARDLFFEYVDEAGAGAKDIEGMKLVIRSAYSTNKRGNLDKSRILSLLPLAQQINHPKVKQACDIITECIRRLDRRVNIRFESRPSTEHRWKGMTIDFSRM